MPFIKARPEFIWWQGFVEDVNDPLMIGRVRVRIVGYHTSDKSSGGIPTDDLPWATVLLPTTSASVSGKGQSPSGLVPGSWVVGFFKDGEDAQQPVIMGTFAGINIPNEDGKLIDTSQGFNDPNGIYPLESYKNEPDTNKLARNEDIENTIVEKKRGDVDDCNPTALGGGWSEPPTPYESKYPMNKVYESESGHVIEIDDTPGSERLHRYHKSGSFEEIHPDGTKVEKIVGDDFRIVRKNNHISVYGDATLNVGENTKLAVGKNFDLQIEGNLRTFVVGNVTMQTNGNFTHKVNGSYSVVSSGPMLLVAPKIDFNPPEASPSSLNPNFRINDSCPSVDTKSKKYSRKKGVTTKETPMIETGLIPLTLATSVVASAAGAIVGNALSSGGAGLPGPPGPPGSIGPVGPVGPPGSGEPWDTEEPTSAKNLEGIPEGSVFPLGASPTEILKAILYPKFLRYDSFTIGINSGPYHVGVSTPQGDYSSSWIINEVEEAIPRSMVIRRDGQSLTSGISLTGNGLTNGNMIMINHPAYSLNNEGLVSFEASLTSNNNTKISKTYSLEWNYPLYAGKYSEPTLTDLTTLSGSNPYTSYKLNQMKSGITREYPATSNPEYFYWCVPKSVNSVSINGYPQYNPNTSFTDVSNPNTTIPVPMNKQSSSVFRTLHGLNIEFDVYRSSVSFAGLRRIKVAE